MESFEDGEQKISRKLRFYGAGDPKMCEIGNFEERVIWNCGELVVFGDKQ
jgi:hypothetical protein